MRPALLLLLCACGAPPPRLLTNRPAAATANTLDAALRQDVGAGASVAILGGAKGLRAISSDGQRQRQLAPGPVPWVLLDERADVVWFGTPDGRGIEVLDLAAPPVPAPRPQLVVTDLPASGEVEMVGSVLYDVSYPSLDPTISPGEAEASGDLFTLGYSVVVAHVRVVLGAEPAVSGTTGYQDDATWAAAVDHASLPGRAFLRTLRARPDHREARAAAATEAPFKVPGVDPRDCEDPDECGAAEPIRGTHYARVLVAHVTGDISHLAHRLYDRDARRFVDGAWATWLTNAWVAPDHAAFLGHGAIVRFDRGPLAVTPAADGGEGGGWLGGGEFFGL